MPTSPRASTEVGYGTLKGRSRKEEFEAVLFMLGKIQFVVFPVELTIFSTMNLVSVAFHLVSDIASMRGTTSGIKPAQRSS
eukprot:2340334-Rhodomonas_salina.3